MTWNDLTLREKIGQTVMLQTIPQDHIACCGSIKEFMKKYPIGGLYRSGALINAKMLQIANFKDVLIDYKSNARVPLLLADDMESGSADNGMLLLPQLMALGAANDKRLAYDYGKALALEAKNAGVNWLFAPVCDLALRKESPIANVRSIGDDPERSAILLEQVVAGMLENGIGATVKHFPCGGAEEMDGHICPADVDISYQEWDRTLAYVYRHLIKAGVPAFMTTHQTFAAAQTPDEMGEYEICTVSRELTTDLLKNKLGFKGVVVSDALVMGGFAGENSAQKMIDCFTAGTDILLWPPVEYIDELEKRILSGEVPMERLEDAGSRIWKLKESLGLFDHQTEEAFDLEFVEDVSKRVGQSCITLVNNKSKRIPFDREKIRKILIVGITPDDNDFAKFTELVHAFGKRGIEAELRRDVWMDELTSEIQKRYDLLIFAMCRLPHHPVGCLDMYGNNANSLWTAHTCDNSKMLPVSFGSPFSYKYFVKDDMYINAYSPSSDVMENFAAAIFGEIPFKGTSPVKLR